MGDYETRREANVRRNQALLEQLRINSGLDLSPPKRRREWSVAEDLALLGVCRDHPEALRPQIVQFFQDLCHSTRTKSAIASRCWLLIDGDARFLELRPVNNHARTSSATWPTRMSIELLELFAQTPRLHLNDKVGLLRDIRTRKKRKLTPICLLAHYRMFMGSGVYPRINDIVGEHSLHLIPVINEKVAELLRKEEMEDAAASRRMVEEDSSTSRREARFSSSLQREQYIAAISCKMVSMQTDQTP